MTTNQCTHYQECNQIKRKICIGAYEHCTIYQKFESLKTPANKIPTHTAKLGIERFLEKYPEWLGVGSAM